MVTTHRAIILVLASTFTSAACGSTPKVVAPPPPPPVVYELVGTYVGGQDGTGGTCGTLGETTVVVTAGTAPNHYYVTHKNPAAAPYFYATGPQLAWQESYGGHLDSCPSGGAGDTTTSSTYSLALDDSGNLLGTLVQHTSTCGVVTVCSWQIALERQ